MDKCTKSLKPTIHVAVGVVTNAKGEVLIAERPAHLLGGGFWEFPGGKIENDEEIEIALKRELKEEVGITVVQSTPLIHISYEYPERKIELHALSVLAYTGTAKSLEGQLIKWVQPAHLHTFKMLPANHAIIEVLTDDNRPR